MSVPAEGQATDEESLSVDRQLQRRPWEGLRPVQFCISGDDSSFMTATKSGYFQLVGDCAGLDQFQDPKHPLELFAQVIATQKCWEGTKEHAWV